MSLLPGYEDDDDDEIEASNPSSTVIHPPPTMKPEGGEIINPLFVQWCQQSHSEQTFSDKLQSLELFWRPNLFDFLCAEHKLDPHASRLPKRVFHRFRSEIGAHLLPNEAREKWPLVSDMHDERILYPEIELDTDGLISSTGEVRTLQETNAADEDAKPGEEQKQVLGINESRPSGDSFKPSSVSTVAEYKPPRRRSPSRQKRQSQDRSDRHRRKRRSRSRDRGRHAGRHTERDGRKNAIAVDSRRFRAF